MRKLFITCTAAAAMFLAGAFTSPRANAMTVAVPAGLGTAIEQADLAQDVAFICRPAWRCGYWGCGWRRDCFWRSGPYWGGGPRFGFYRPYRPGWGWGHGRF